MNKPYFRIKILKYTPYQKDVVYSNLVGKEKLVKEVAWAPEFYECKTGELVLKTDCEILIKKEKL